MEQEPLRIIVSGGGTGGHIFPAISIADAIRAASPGAEILFVGAEGRMEMQRVPRAGYDIVGLPVCGFNRKHLLSNVKTLWKLLLSQRRARKVIARFRPMAAVGVGGYASGPTLREAQKKGIPTLLQEQNSYAGVTNKLLAKRAKKICVAYEGMERFFPKENIILTGNPVRAGLLNCKATKEEAALSFGLDPSRPVVLITGGSLGARTLNESVLSNLPLIRQSSTQFLWQTGGVYKDEIERALESASCPENLHMTPFLDDMAMAYRAADVVISRAGAGSISELCLLGKAAILVPSPNVAEDHQKKNALALTNKDAALMVEDSAARLTLIPQAINLAGDKDELLRLSACIHKMARPDAAKVIAREVVRLARGESGMGECEKSQTE